MFRKKNSKMMHRIIRAGQKYSWEPALLFVVVYLEIVA